MTAIRVIDRGADKVLRSAKKTKKPAHVDVGILGEKAGASKEEGGLTVGQVAEWAELGLGQPKRSWLRGWIDTHEDEISERIDKEGVDVIMGKRAQDQALKRIGVWLQGQIQENIANFPGNEFQPNSPSTIEAKGSSVPLIDTGQLRSSIAHRVEQGT